MNGPTSKKSSRISRAALGHEGRRVRKRQGTRDGTARRSSPVPNSGPNPPAAKPFLLFKHDNPLARLGQQLGAKDARQACEQAEKCVKLLLKSYHAFTRVLPPPTTATSKDSGWLLLEEDMSDAGAR